MSRELQTIKVDGKSMKVGTDWHEYQLDKAKKILLAEGFVEEEGRFQQFMHRNLHHFQHTETKQNASISLEIKTKIAKISYSLPKSMHHKRRTKEEIRRANYVQYD